MPMKGFQALEHRFHNTFVNLPGAFRPVVRPEKPVDRWAPTWTTSLGLEVHSDGCST